MKPWCYLCDERIQDEEDAIYAEGTWWHEQCWVSYCRQIQEDLDKEKDNE
jgi:hypothetical protein